MTKRSLHPHLPTEVVGLLSRELTGEVENRFAEFGMRTLTRATMTRPGLSLSERGYLGDSAGCLWTLLL
jgi:hypothetical protein